MTSSFTFGATALQFSLLANSACFQKRLVCWYQSMATAVKHLNSDTNLIEQPPVRGDISHMSNLTNQSFEILTALAQ